MTSQLEGLPFSLSGADVADALHLPPVTGQSDSSMSSTMLAEQLMTPSVPDIDQLPKAAPHDGIRERIGRLTTGQKISAVVGVVGLVGVCVVGANQQHGPGLFGTDRANTTSAPETTVPKVPGQTNQTVPTTDSPETPTTPVVIPPKDYKLAAISFGKADHGCRELGKYYTKAAVLSFSLRGHPHTVDVPQTEYDLITCGSNSKVTITKTGVNTQTNTVKKLVSIDQDSLVYKANAPSAKTVDQTFVVKGPLPAQQLQAKGYPGACAALPKLVGCPGVPVPGDYLLSAAEVKKYKDSAVILGLQAVQSSCAKVETNAERKVISQSFELQASKQGVSPAVVSEAFVNAAGKPDKTVPNYVDKLIAAFVKAGGVSKSTTLFAPGTHLTAFCQAPIIKPAKAA